MDKTKILLADSLTPPNQDRLTKHVHTTQIKPSTSIANPMPFTSDTLALKLARTLGLPHYSQEVIP